MQLTTRLISLRIFSYLKNKTGYSWLTANSSAERVLRYNNSQEEHELSNHGNTKNEKQNSDRSSIACKTLFSHVSVELHLDLATTTLH